MDRNSAIVTSLTLIGYRVGIGRRLLVRTVQFPTQRLVLSYLSTMMLPGEVTLIPSYLIFKTLGWVDSFAP